MIFCSLAKIRKQKIIVTKETRFSNVAVIIFYMDKLYKVFCKNTYINVYKPMLVDFLLRHENTETRKKISQ